MKRPKPTPKNMGRGKPYNKGGKVKKTKKS